MHWLSVLTIAFASNLDNLAIGIAFGVRSTRIPTMSNVIIALITMVGTYLSMTIGEIVAFYMSGLVANVLGAVLISGIGLWTIVDSWRKWGTEIPVLNHETSSDPIRNPYAADVDKNNIISVKESVALGIALAMNNLAVGIGAGATSVSPLLTTMFAGLFSLAFIGFGSKVGYVMARTWFGKYSGIIGGVLLFLIGIYEMIA
ncbi:sporulation membrane protein YtaF [Aneurinibacillus uraniidurans]|uniref:sporulation membrane protein YtaF n=1 Tax=Aneurinibacillus uraniidurans TaxID=2966586 RepID=UPI00234AAEEF|nr:sporulation membrane protein YtaF [Aneurinibacillus sp. B1]WCN37343.1 sporulation membrane protein YtaF [Aneurinibacillus sp. B1]